MLTSSFATTQRQKYNIFNSELTFAGTCDSVSFGFFACSFITMTEAWFAVLKNFDECDFILMAVGSLVFEFVGTKSDQTSG